jgi:hypothetical protein
LQPYSFALLTLAENGYTKHHRASKTAVLARLLYSAEKDAMSENSPRGDRVLGQIKFDLHSSVVQAFFKTMSDAREEFEKAHLRYKYALSVAADTGPLNFDGKLALQQSGREYAKAVVQWSNAVMAWLAFVDRSASGNL